MLPRGTAIRLLQNHIAVGNDLVDLAGGIAQRSPISCCRYVFACGWLPAGGSRLLFLGSADCRKQIDIRMVGSKGAILPAGDHAAFKFCQAVDV